MTIDGTKFAHDRQAKQVAKDQVRDRMKRAELWKKFVQVRAQYVRENPNMPPWMGWHVAAELLWAELESWEREYAEYGGPNPLDELTSDHYPENYERATPIAEKEISSETEGGNVEEASLPPELADGDIDLETMKWVAARYATAVLPAHAPTQTHYSLWAFARKQTTAFFNMLQAERKKVEREKTNFDDDGREDLGRVNSLLGQIPVGQKHAQETREAFLKVCTDDGEHKGSNEKLV